MQIEKQLPELLESHHTLGLNAFPLYYKTDYWLWINNAKFGNCVYKRENVTYKPYFPLESNVGITKTCMSASFALDFAVKMGYEKAILYGILDGETNSYKHFYDQVDKPSNIKNLQQLKTKIDSHRDKIEVEIPFGTM